MRIYMIDVSGRVVNYDIAICEALHALPGDETKLFLTDAKSYKGSAPVKHLLGLVPTKYKNSGHLLKRGAKALEGVINYSYLFWYCLVKTPDVIHLQWLPFLEFCSLEAYLLKIFKTVFRRTRFILTIHNVYPHDLSDSGKSSYRQRFLRVAPSCDAFIVHTEVTRKEVASEFDIAPERIRVIHHGVFVPDLSGLKVQNSGNHDKLRLIVFGNQNHYKGTDLLVAAMSQLPQSQKDKVELSIMGQISPAYYQEIREKEDGVTVHWTPYFVDDRTLYQSILDSDIIVLPYRAISQSGVLLLSLFFNKIIVCSDLPAFKETLKGYPEELFFRSGDEASLQDVLSRLVVDGVNIKTITPIMEHLREAYSWSAAAAITQEVYNDVVEKN